MDPNQTPDKGKTERVPSPGSASSIHSIRPLEWDSGADIGYQNPSEPNLSTVERIALQNGSSGLYKSNETYNRSQGFGNPLAESSPFVRAGASGTSKNTPKALVDYTIGSDQSFDEQSGLATRSDPVKGSSEISKSLEDLRHIGRAHTLNGNSKKSISSQNLTLVDKHHKKFTSSSSVSTVIPQELRRQMSNKSIQVDERSLLNLLEGMAHDVKDNCSTYTISSKDDSKGSKSGHTESTSGSVDGGSFEYVPGSQYNSKRTSETHYSNSSSGVNTLCNEVVDGVDLITKYVDNLNISNKKKVLQKVAQSLLNKVDKSPQDSENSLKEVNFPAAFPVRIDSPSQLVVNSDMVFQPIQIPQTDKGDKSSATSKFESTSIEDAKTSDSVDRANLRKTTNRRLIESTKSRILQSSDFSRSSSSIKTIPTYTNNSNSYAISATENSTKDGSDAYSLKRYLAKEREAQLLWIKSGIDHLNNLKKLYESQKVLKKDLSSYKRSTTQKANVTTSETDHVAKPQPELRKPKRTPKCKSIQTSTSDINEDSPIAPAITSRMLPDHTESTKNTISTKKLIVKKYCKKYQSTPCRNCSCSSKRAVSENKENIEHIEVSPRKAKKPISYTVLFDKTHRRDDEQGSIKKPTKKSERVIYFENKTSQIQTDSQPCPSLQEYLLKNKPEYVDKAEFRRQCLYEISQLRELRDKSKNELMSLITNSDESDINTIRRHLPPAPLTVMRIFNDRALRKQTEKKYQQLPEVLNKKLEQKRRENNRRNQIMAKVFTKKLQRKVLKGHVNLANSVSVISN